MNKSFNLSKKTFAVYGLGTTGLSVIRYFKKIGFKNFVAWDDNKDLKNGFDLNKKKFNHFYKSINLVDYIIVSPGINLQKAQLKKILFKNKSKIITDVDLFYMLNSKVRSIVVTGTNGKSTTCKIVEHILKENKFNTSLGGNIGKPILDLNIKKNSLVVIEASSFQLAYSKFIKPNYALLLNITNDHLDWHGSMKNYIDSKFRIFLNQKKNNFAFLNNEKLKKKYKKKQYQAKLKFVDTKNFKKIKKKNKKFLFKLKSK